MLVSPSQSGRYALPFLMREHPRLRGFVAIAPSSTENYTWEQFWAVEVLGGDPPHNPTLPPVLAPCPGGKGLKSHWEDS